MATHYVYWMRDLSCTRVDEHGYVGVTRNPQKRWTNHRHDRVRYSGRWEGIEPTEMIILMSGTLEECMDMEFRLRPVYDIGWNRNPGGDPLRHPWPTKGGLC